MQRFFRRAASCLLTLPFVTLPGLAANRITIHADQGEHTIAPEIYGHFAEHLGRCIYGGIWVGEDSPIPNINGYRKDVVEALKALDIPVLRWPGGCFADEYHWAEGVGPRESRPPMLNTHWGRVVEDNSFGTHEFLALCDYLGCDAYIAGNVGSGTVEEMQDWVEYMTYGGESEMANLRRANGRDEPWKVRYFGVGNENWGCGGEMTADYYADLYKRYSTYVRDYSGNDIVKIACGPGGFDRGWREWLETLLEKAGRRMDAISVHYYVFTGRWGDKGEATDFNERDWFVLMQKTLELDNGLKDFCELMDQHDRRKRIGLFVDEWGTWWNKTEGTKDGFLEQQNSLRDAISAGIFLNLFNKYCERVRMANIAQTVNVLQAMVLTQDDQMILTPTYHVFEMYKVHQGATMLPTEADVENITSDDDAIPGLNCSASKSEDGRIHLTVCNLQTSAASKVEVNLEGASITEAAGRVLTGDKMQAHNTFESPTAVQPKPLEGLTINDGKLTVELPPHSVAVLEIK